MKTFKFKNRRGEIEYASFFTMGEAEEYAKTFALELLGEIDN